MKHNLVQAEGVLDLHLLQAFLRPADGPTDGV